MTSTDAPYIAPSIVIDGSRYTLHTRADETVSLHVEVPHWLRYDLKRLAHAEGATMQQIVQEAMSEWCADRA